MDPTGFSSPRPDCFPSGLRVLVVDDDPTWLKILEKMLKKCNYEVTTCNLAREALDLLRERKDGFDIVISDVNMPDMDGFKLLEHVGLEMDLPVIMMSVDGETSRVMKGVQHGACDYLLKPIRMKELRNIWQHVLRKRIHEVRDIEGHESLEDMMRNGSEQSDESYFFGGDPISGKKRKDIDNDRLCGEHSSMKKVRVVWTVDLHQKFVKAVNQIGFEKVGPKKILDLMGVAWLTRENVASHLQKYRLYLSRLQKENELKASFGGTKHSDMPQKDLAGNVCLQNSIPPNSISLHKNMLANDSYTFSGNKVLIHNDDPKIFNRTVTGIPMSTSESKKAIFDAPDLPKISSSRMSFDHSFGPDVKSDPKIQAQYSWSNEGPSTQFKQGHNPHIHSEPRFNHQKLPMNHVGADFLGPSLAANPRTSSKQADKPPQAGLAPSYGISRSQSNEKVTKVESTAALFSGKPDSHLTVSHAAEPAIKASHATAPVIKVPHATEPVMKVSHASEPVRCPTWNPKKNNLEQNLFDDLISYQRNLFNETGSSGRLWDEGFNSYSCPGDFYPPNVNLGNAESFGCSSQELVPDVPPLLYDSLNFEFGFPVDLVEYPVIDQGLYIA